MELTFLGTSGMMPTKQRNPSAVFLDYKGEGILFDCGEGTQRQLKIAGIPITKVSRILLSHWHGDHMLGLPGLIQSLGAAGYTNTLEIYGPKGTQRFLKVITEQLDLDFKVPLKGHDVESGTIVDTKDFTIEALPMKHRIPTIAFAFCEKDRRRIKLEEIKKLGIPEGPLLGELQQGDDVKWKGRTVAADKVTYVVKGKKVAFITDTRPNPNCAKIAKDADLLICESIYAHALQDKAEEYMHMTSRESAQIASRANAKKLILTHFSPRYAVTDEILNDAKDVFDDVKCAFDFMKVKL